MGDMCTVCGHYYELGEHVYCLWPLLWIGSTCVLFVATTMNSLWCTLFVATTMNWKYMCTVCHYYEFTTVYSVCGHHYELQLHVYCLWPHLKLGVHVYCLCPLLMHSLQCTPPIVFRVQYNNNIVSTLTYTLFIIVIFLFYYYILKLYLLPPGGEESPWMNASHWRQKQIFSKFFSSFNTSYSLTAPTSTSWVTHVLFVATTTNWEYTCTVCGYYYQLQVHVYCLWPLL